MRELLQQLPFATDDSEETRYVRRMKEMLAANPIPRGQKLTANYKIPYALHGELMAAADRHGMTVTDLVMVWFDQIIPVLQKAKPVDVPGYTEDMRTKAAIALKAMRGRRQDRGVSK